jgi:hypothetical protein
VRNAGIGTVQYSIREGIGLSIKKIDVLIIEEE